MEQYAMFINQIGVRKRKNLDNYYRYLYHHNLYDDSNFICEQETKVNQIEVKFGNLTTQLNKRDVVLIADSDKEWNYTNVFHLDQDFVPTLAELETIKATWLKPVSEITNEIFNSKFFKEEYDFNYNLFKKETYKDMTSEEIEEATIQKSAIMLYDFYNQYDIDFRNKNRNNTPAQQTDIFNVLYDRLSKNAVADIKHINELKNSKNTKIADRIIDNISEYCVTTIDYVKQSIELSKEAASKGFNLKMTKEELFAAGLYNPKTNNIDIEGYFNKMKEKYVTLQKEADALKNAKKEIINTIPLEEKPQELSEYDKELKEFDEIKKEAQEMGMVFTSQFRSPKVKFGAVFNDDDSFKIGILSPEDEFLNLDKNEVLRYRQYCEALAKAEEKQEEVKTEDVPKGISKLEEYGSNQINWKNKQSSYKNEFMYEKNCPLPLRGRKQFCCWKTEWVPSKKLLSKKEFGIYDKLRQDDKGIYWDGKPLNLAKNEKDQYLLPLFDNGQPVINEKGEVELDGKFGKIPYNGNVKYDEKEPWKSKAKSNDERTWATFDVACKAVRENGYDGLGIMLGKSLMGIDVDHVIGADGKFTEEAQWIVETANSYTEFSPSKTGFHILTFGEMPKNARKRNGNLEIYGEGRFFTLTGDIVNGVFKKITNKMDGTANINRIYDKFMPDANTNEKYSSKTSGNKTIVDWGNKENSLKLTNEQIITKLIATGERNKNKEMIFDKSLNRLIKNVNYGINIEEELINGDWSRLYTSQSRADIALVGKIWFYTDSPAQVDDIMRESILYRDKWDEYRGSRTYGQMTIESVIDSSNPENKYDPKWKPQSKNKKEKGMTL